MGKGVVIAVLRNERRGQKEKIERNMNTENWGARQNIPIGVQREERGREIY